MTFCQLKKPSVLSNDYQISKPCIHLKQNALKRGKKAQISSFSFLLLQKMDF